jgi:hypothetical protein
MANDSVQHYSRWGSNLQVACKYIPAKAVVPAQKHASMLYLLK